MVWSKAKKLGMEPSAYSQTIALDPRASEDCLFLDVHVPKYILDKASSKTKPGVFLSRCVRDTNC